MTISTLRLRNPAIYRALRLLYPILKETNDEDSLITRPQQSNRYGIAFLSITFLVCDTSSVAY